MGRARRWLLAIVAAALLAGPMAGFAHRIAHGAAAFDDAPAASYLHACAAYDALLLASALENGRACHAAPFVHQHAAAMPAHAAPLLPFMARFLSRAPPPGALADLPDNLLTIEENHDAFFPLARPDRAGACRPPLQRMVR